MGVSFFETMRGGLLDESGRSHFVEFNIKVEASRNRHFLRSGLTRLSGTVDAGPWARGTPAVGSMRLSLFRHRSIEYEVNFGGEDGQYQLRGKKSLGLRPSSFVTMETQLLRMSGAKHELLAQGQMFFDFNDLGHFLNSWRPHHSVARRQLRAPLAGAPEPKPDLSPRQSRTLHALAEACIVPGRSVPAYDEKTLQAALSYLQRVPNLHGTAYKAALALLDVQVMRHASRGLASLDVQARRRALKLIDPAYLQAATLPVKIAHFNRADYHAKIGYSAPKRPPREPDPRHASQVVPAEQLETEQEIEVEVVIIGSGAGGAPLAAELAQKGYAVAVVEEGHYRRRHNFGGDPIEQIASQWRVPAVSVGDVNLSVPTGRGVGGTTTINSGTCFAAPDAVLNSWRKDLGFPDDFAPELFGPTMDRVLETLEVQPAARKQVGRIGDFIERGAHAMGLEYSHLPRNAPGCSGAAVCAFGCPDGAKRSTEIAYMPKALGAGAVAFTGLPLTRILTHGRRAVGIEARGTDEHGSPKRLVIRAQAVVLACGTLETPLLLQDNGIDLPALGRNLSIHPATAAFGRTSRALDTWQSIPQGCGVETHGLERIRYEGAWVPPAIFAAGLPLVGADLARWMDDFDKVAQFGFMLTDFDRGRVMRGPDGRAMFRYRLSEEAQTRINQGTALLAELMLKAGAEEVITTATAAQRFTNRQQARDLAHKTRLPKGTMLTGFHPLGTCAMGHSRATSVVDFEHRVHGTENLFVVDGSVVPTPLGVNPQVTIMSFALRAAECIAAQLEAD